MTSCASRTLTYLCTPTSAAHLASWLFPQSPACRKILFDTLISWAKKPPAMQVEWADFSVSYTKKHRSGILETATNRNQTERRTLGMQNKANDTYSLSHTSWKCQYHIVFAPKYRRKAIYGKLKKEIGAILRELCERKHVNIIEAHAMPDHIHMLVEIPPNQRVSDFMGYLKGKSTMIIFERFSNLKYKYGNRHFWCRGYYVSTVGGIEGWLVKHPSGLF